MSTRDSDALSAVVARQRGRARLRTATIAFGAASLVAAGAVAYHLPGAATSATTAVGSTGSTVSTAAASNGTSTVVHTTSGGSGVVTTTTSNGTTVTVPAAGSRAHAASGGS